MAHATQGNATRSFAQPTRQEARAIVRIAQTNFDDFVRKYDERKYPPDVYDRLLAAFRRPAAVSASDLREAVLWKYGHLGKRRIPPQQELLISQLQQKWPATACRLVGEPERVFSAIYAALGRPTRYITASFLAHLVRPDDIPIIDQHNFRAVNYYLGKVRPQWRRRAKPSAFHDIQLLASFLSAIEEEWRSVAGSGAPSHRTLDQYLMMFGKSLKPPRRSRRTT